MSLPSYFYGNKVVGWQPDAPEQLQELLREVAREDMRAEHISSLRKRRRAFRKKDAALCKAFELFPENFLLRRELGRRRGCITFVSKIGYPTSRCGEHRFRVHIPVSVLKESQDWQPLAGKVLLEVQHFNGCKYRMRKTVGIWPEDRVAPRRHSPRQQPHYHRRRVQVAPSIA